MIKAVIFDMDGVLVNSEPYHFKVEKQLLENMGISITDKEIESFVGLAMDKMWGRIKETYSLDESIENLVKEDTGFRVSFFAEIEKLDPIEGVKDFIESVIAKKLKTAVASSSHTKLIETVLEKTGLSEYFPEIVSGFDVRHGKPYPDIFLKTAELLGVKADECIVVEDSFNGVKAARSAGMICIAYRNPESGNQDLSGADHIIDSFSSAADKLKEIIEFSQRYSST